MEQNVNQKLLEFISRCPTAWHGAETLASRLRDEGYRELPEYEDWALRPGERCFVRRNGSSLIAFRVPRGAFPGFMLMAAHLDSPALAVKQLETVTGAGQYAQLGVERYGGMLLAPWLDRPLSVAGRVVVRDGDRLSVRLVNLDRDLLLIPNLAIHLDRSANEERRYDVKTDMLPVAGLGGDGLGFRRLVAREAGARAEDILSAELRLYVRERGTVWGMEEEFVSSPRLDDLQCAFACAEGFLQAADGAALPLLCLFDNEEVGSGSGQGADSTFLGDTLLRLCRALGLDGSDYRRLLAQSLMVSADNAHAVHPNHPEVSDRCDRPSLNGGVVIKHNAARRYTTDAVSEALFAEVCRRAEVPVQHYSNRADLAGGSTLGHISLSQVSLNSVDIGLPQLAMHSCYETAGARDTDYLIRAARLFFASALRCVEGGFELLTGEGEGR